MRNREAEFGLLLVLESGLKQVDSTCLLARHGEEEMEVVSCLWIICTVYAIYRIR